MQALRIVVIDESLGDFVYAVREKTLSDVSYAGSSWDHPRVKAFSDAVQILTEYVHDHSDRSA